MPKVEDYVAYFNELAKKAGLPEEQAKAVLEALNNETIRNGFVPRPNYSSDLDKIKEETAEAVRKNTQLETKKFYDDWWAKEGQPAIDQARSVYNELGKYKEQYGPLDGSPNPNPANGNGNYLTRDELQKILTDQLPSVLKPIIDTGVNTSHLFASHLKEFGEVLDPKSLEKFAYERGYTNPQQAYEAYIAPRRVERQNTEWEEKVKKAREEGAIEERSRQTTVGARDREYVNPFVHPKKVEDANTAEMNQRTAFAAGWDEAANKK